MILRASKILPALALALAGALAPSAARAQTPVLSPTPRFAEKTGAEMYANVCQACHMSDGKGAAGAAVFPSLAGNVRLAAGGYGVSVVVSGLRGMPAFGGMMSDEQVAAVVNYVRANFGNKYTDALTPEDAANARR